MLLVKVMFFLINLFVIIHVFFSLLVLWLKLQLIEGDENSPSDAIRGKKNCASRELLFLAMQARKTSTDATKIILRRKYLIKHV